MLTHIFTALAVAVALPALGCECRSLTACELIHQPTIFIGEVIDGGVPSIQVDPWYANVDHVRFKVLENFRGLPADARTVDVQLMPTSGMCSPIPYFPGRTYLVVPHEREGKFYEGVCYASRDVEMAPEDVSVVREYFTGKMPLNVRGRVAVTGNPDMVDYLLRTGETKPLARVTISTSRNGRTYSALTNADGRYSLSLPGAGDYGLDALLAPYVSSPMDVSVPGSGCAVQDFGLTVDNTISGMVRDEKGQPVESARVGLIDLDRPASGSEGHAWLNHAYTEQSDTSFRFDNVPLGRYLLVFNPDGPRSGDLAGLPFESTYYPLRSARTDARPVVIDSGGIHLTGMDLIVGRQVEFRNVNVRVRFPDGTPMKTALIVCAGQPLQRDDFPWVFQKAAIRDGSVEFLAPANRKLRLEVRDWHGRDMKRTYSAIHEPGTTPITQEFVVEP